jgi:MYXO-CTERM domain-containing protein
MKRFLLLIVVCAVSLSELDAAVVNGKVMFLTKRGQKPVVNETLVWLDPLGRAPKRPGSAFTMTTRSKAFLPHVMAIPAGSTVSFPNEDPIAHNLFSLTPGNTFDLGLYRKGAGKSHKFAEPGAVNVYCNVHPNMSAVVHVMNTPFYGFTDQIKGVGSALSEVQPGLYKVSVPVDGSVQIETTIRAEEQPLHANCCNQKPPVVHVHVNPRGCYCTTPGNSGDGSKLLPLAVLPVALLIWRRRRRSKA